MVPTQNSHSIVGSIENGLYTNPEKWEVAERLAIEIRKVKSSKGSDLTTTLYENINFERYIESLESTGHNVAMRLKESAAEISGDTDECCDKDVDVYK